MTGQNSVRLHPKRRHKSRLQRVHVVLARARECRWKNVDDSLSFSIKIHGIGVSSAFVLQEHCNSVSRCGGEGHGGFKGLDSLLVSAVTIFSGRQRKPFRNFPPFSASTLRSNSYHATNGAISARYNYSALSFHARSESRGNSAISFTSR